MTKPWLPEHPVDEALACALVAEQFPDVDTSAPVYVGSGFDNDLWRFGELVFRFPRRAVAVSFIAREIDALPRLAPFLPLAIPGPSHIGRPAAAFPYPFYGHAFLRGTTGDRACMSDDQRCALAPQLAAFFAALHSIDIAHFNDCLPIDTWRSDMARRSELIHQHGTRLQQSEVWPQIDTILKAGVAGPASAHESGFCVVHGDPYARHLLLDDERKLCAVIDWGDIAIGDRAVDLHLIYTCLPPAGRALFFDHYGPVDAQAEARARHFALSHTCSVLAYADDVKDEPLWREGLLSLERLSL